MWVTYRRRLTMCDRFRKDGILASSCCRPSILAISRTKDVSCIAFCLIPCRTRLIHAVFLLVMAKFADRLVGVAITRHWVVSTECHAIYASAFTILAWNYKIERLYLCRQEKRTSFQLVRRFCTERDIYSKQFFSFVCLFH